MSEIVSGLQDSLLNVINSLSVSADNIEGILILLLFLFLLHEVSQKLVHFAGWLLGVVFIFQFCYCMSFTGIDSYMHFSTFFKYDVLTAIAQYFAGTKICNALLWTGTFMQVICNGLAGFLLDHSHVVTNFTEG